MTFYIPPFWCGVIATLVIEFAVLIIYTMIRERKDEKENRR